MQGMRFLLLNENGQPINNGVITQQITPDRYMCTFMRPPQVSRLCHVDEIGQWNLFPNDEALQNFVNVIQAEQMPATATPPEGDEPPGDEPPTPPTPPRKKAAKKKAAKKKVSKKRNAKN